MFEHLKKEHDIDLLRQSVPTIKINDGAPISETRTKKIIQRFALFKEKYGKPSAA
jgi:hypothetical protein